MKPHENLDPLLIGGKAYGSRLLVGTGKYKVFAETKAAIEASGAEIVTVAIRRTNIGQNPNEPSLLDYIPPSRFMLLPNTAGCYNAEDAVRTLRLARELLDGHDLVKLEVLGDPKTLYPNMVDTIAAARTLVAEGFKVMVYCSDDPIIAKQLEEIGCVAVMPLASLMRPWLEGCARCALVRFWRWRRSPRRSASSGSRCRAFSACAPRGTPRARLRPLFSLQNP